MNALAEVGLVTGRELKKNFRSIKGIVLLVLTLLGGFGATMLQIWLDQLKAGKMERVDADSVRESQLKVLSQEYPQDVANYLADAPTTLFAILTITLWLGPLLIALLGFDGISGEVQHRTVRFWANRTRRPSFYVGKVLGVWSVVSIVWFALNVIVWIAVTARGAASFGACLSWGIRFWLLTLPISLVWCSLGALISSQFRSPMVALLVTFGAFFVVWILYIVARVGAMFGSDSFGWFMHVYPNYFDRYLLAPKPDAFIGGLLWCIGASVFTTTLGAWRFATRDI